MKKYPVVRDNHDHRDYKFVPTKYTVENLPVEVDLSPKCSPIGNQLNLGCCTGFGIVKGFREYLLNNSNQPYVPLSPLFLYYQERSMEGTINQDAGACIRDGMQTLQQIGVCPEQDDPYVIEKFTQPPSQMAMQNAAAYKITEYHRVNNFDDMKHALAEGFPVVFGAQIFQSFESSDVAQNGIVPMPSENEQCLGGHCMLSVAYKTLTDGKEYAKVRNSWGTGWALQGYCWIPREYFDKYVMDMWTGKV